VKLSVNQVSTATNHNSTVRNDRSTATNHPTNATNSPRAAANSKVFNECVDAPGRKKYLRSSFAFLAKVGLEQIACHLPIALFRLNAEC